MPRTLMKPDPPVGPMRDFVEEIHALWDLALRPAMAEVVKAIEKINKQTPLRTTASRETVRRVLKGPSVRTQLKTVDAVVQGLCHLAEVDPYEVVASRSSQDMAVTRLSVVLDAWRAVLDAEWSSSRSHGLPQIATVDLVVRRNVASDQPLMRTEALMPAAVRELAVDPRHRREAQRIFLPVPRTPSHGQKHMSPGSSSAPGSTSSAEISTLTEDQVRGHRLGSGLDHIALPQREVLEDGPFRDLVVALYELHGRASKPMSWHVVALRTAEIDPKRVATPMQVADLLQGRAVPRIFAPIAGIVEVLVRHAPSDRSFEDEIRGFKVLWRYASASATNG